MTLASGFRVPDLTTETLGIIGKRGSGKSHTGTLIVEELLELESQVVVIDPTGGWWGLRAGADGKKAGGYPIPIFGGLHGDMPLEEKAGALLAEYLVENRLSAVIDLSGFSKSAMRRFVRDFAEHFYLLKRKKSDPVHIVIDECDLFCLSEDTELLTRAGWKKWQDIRVGEDAVCFDMSGPHEKYVYAPVQRLIVRKFDGEMVHIKTKSFDCLATPEHRVVLKRMQRAKGRVRYYDWTFSPAAKVPHHVAIPCGGAPVGPGFSEPYGLYALEQFRILGWIITDGCFHNSKQPNRKICIEQSAATVKGGVRTAEEMDRVLMSLPGVTRYTRMRKGSKQYRWYLGGNASKPFLRVLGDELHRIPHRLIEQASRNELNALYQGLLEGDGTCGRKGRWSGFFPGLEEGLADDFQEVALRLGVNTSKHFAETIGQWQVRVATLRKHHWIQRGIKKQPYRGNVWDITVPTGAFVARRAGRVFVTGNCPQNVDTRDMLPLVGAVYDLSLRGRQRGIGVTLISQRPARINKDVLTQIEILIAFRLTGPQDISAFAAWIKHNGTKEEQQEVLSTLASLERGVGWFWAPGLMNGLLRQVNFRARNTYDSSRTPDGKRVKPPKTLADVDLGELDDAMKAQVERAKLEDPKALKAEVMRLKKELEKKPQAMPPKIQAAPKPPRLPKRVEVPILTKRQEAKLEKQVKALVHALGLTTAQADAAVEKAEALATAHEDLLKRLKATVASARTSTGAAAGSPPVPSPRRSEADDALRTGYPRLKAALKVGKKLKEHVVKIEDAEVKRLGKGERACMIAIAQHGDVGVTRHQLTQLTSYKRSTRNAYVARLASAGYVDVSDNDDRITRTDAGTKWLGTDYEELPVGDALANHWIKELPDGEGKILGLARANYPNSISREDIDEEFPMFAKSTRNAYIARLRARCLVVELKSGDIRLEDTLVDEENRQ